MTPQPRRRLGGGGGGVGCGKQQGGRYAGGLGPIGGSRKSDNEVQRSESDELVYHVLRINPSYGNMGAGIMYYTQNRYQAIADSGPGLPSDRTLSSQETAAFAGGGLLRWQVESRSWACILEESRVSRRLFSMR